MRSAFPLRQSASTRAVGSTEPLGAGVLHAFIPLSESHSVGTALLQGTKAGLARQATGPALSSSRAKV